MKTSPDQYCSLLVLSLIACCCRAKEKAWPHPTIANGKLHLRDQDVLPCYDVK
jgi:hypothetical protein